MRRAALLLLSLVVVRAAWGAAPDLGHAVPGTLGLQAGSQLPTGVYVADRMVLFHSSDLRDRDGRPILRGFQLDAFANQIGVSAAYRVRAIHTYVNASVSLPLARVVGGSGDARASIDRFGLADAFIEPLQLGWRLTRLELVVGYGFSVPTGRFEPGGSSGVSRGSWAHVVSLGYIVYFDRGRAWHLSSLASWELDEHKLGLDLTRGSTVQLQGGAGRSLWRVLDAGVVGYALWQVTDDTGTALPPELRGARDRTYGIGAELDVTLADARSRVVVRYAHDVGARSRPEGQILVVEIDWAPWKPRARK